MEHEAQTVIDALKGHPYFLKFIDRADLETALGDNADGKEHPVAYLARSPMRGGLDHAAQVLANLERAIRTANGNANCGAWVREELAAACREPSLANASAKLGEIRALGYLREANLDLKPVPRAENPTPDFASALDEIAVEVQTKLMNEDEAKRLSAWSAEGFPPDPPKPFAWRWTEVFPAGRPKAGETIAENVTQKLAQLKPRALQATADRATLLWVDLQDEDWWAAGPEHAAPLSVSGPLHFSGPLWHAAYGSKGTPFFEGYVTGGRVGLGHMAHQGLFEQSPDWAGVVFSLPRSTIFFENPSASVRASKETLQSLASLPWFQMPTSRSNWPAQDLQERIALDRQLLQRLAEQSGHED